MMHRFFSSTFLLSLFFMLTTLNAAAETNIEFVLDLSGSMRQKLGSETQITSAIKALGSALDEIPADGSAAVRVYGHRADQSNKEESCKDTELLYAFQKIDKPAILEKLSNLTPKGYTPIAYSLNETRNDLLDVSIDKEAERIVVLLTDGEETCGGDPIAVLKKLRAEGFKLKVFTVGFNINDIAKKQLQEIADFSGGKFFDAKDGPGLHSALREATKASVEATVIEKSKTTYGDSVRGGNSFEDAAALPLDKELKLDHHQKVGDYDYFYIDAKRGEKISVQIASLQHGIFLNNGKVEQNNNPCGGIVLTNSKREKLAAKDITGERFKRDEAVIVAPEDGRYYLLVGSLYAAVNKDQITFRGQREAIGDAGTQTDAGNAPETALPIKAGRYPLNHLGSGDPSDVFSFDGKAGDKLTIGIIPNASESPSFGLRVYDEFKQVLDTEYSSANAGLKSKELLVKEDGTYYLEITVSGGSIDRVTNYTLLLRIRNSDQPGEPAGEGGR